MPPSHDGRARYHRAARYSGGFNASAVVALVSERGEGSRGPIAIDALVVTRQAVARGVGCTHPGLFCPSSGSV